MARTSNIQHSSSRSTEPISVNCRNLWNNDFFSLPNEIKDKRLLVRSTIDQPTHLKFRRRKHLELMKIKKSRVKDNTLGGYNPYRGDFSVEYDDKAEYLLGLAGHLNNYHFEACEKNCIKREDSNLIANLQIALAEQYNLHLKERERRKNIIKRHGLMNQKGTELWFSRLELALGKSQAKKIIRLCPLTSADEIEYLSASLGMINQKRAEVNKLTYYRTQRGITSKQDMNIFERERGNRDTPGQRVDVRNLSAPPPVQRKKTSLEIFHLPRFKELSPKEVELCSSNRLEPSTYLDIKDSLISDCKKNNGLLLKKARKLIKIDVNKTRKIFDLLLEEGHTWMPDQGNIEVKPKKRGKKFRK